MKKYFQFLIIIPVLLFGLIVQVTAGEFVVPPDTAVIAIRTNGPYSSLTYGDWWTNSDVNAGNSEHEYDIYVPGKVPATFTINLELYDPESFQTALELDTKRGTKWDSTTFRLVAPDGSTEIVSETFDSLSTTSELWYSFASFTAQDYGYGVYKLYVSTSFDDQNFYRLKIVESDPDGIANNGDEIYIASVKTAVQHVGDGCENYCFFVPETPTLRLSNFDMDNNISIDYTDPNNVTTPGTMSGLTLWNNSTSTAFPPPGGDVFTNPTSGWWNAEICAGNKNQYVFYAEGALFFGGPPAHPDIDITVTDGVSYLERNTSTTFQITVTNNGTGPALSTTLTDTIPTDATYQSATGSPVVTTAGSYTILTWDFGDMLPENSENVSVTVSINSDAVDPMTHTAYAAHTDILYNTYTGLNGSDVNNIGTPGSIGNLVFQDANANGIYDTGDDGLENVTVYLTDSNGDTTASETSGADGSYLFSNIFSGTYTLYINTSSLPGGAILTTGNLPLEITLAEGQNYLTADFGYDTNLIPVELTLFTARHEQKHVLIEWETQTESQNLGFNILRSTSGINGQYIKLNSSLIEGAGDSETKNSYKFQDTGIEPEKTYHYILEDITYSGKTTQNGPIEVKTAAIPQNYSLEQNYPNPFNPTTTIKYSLKESGFADISIYNIRGQLITTLVSQDMGVGEYQIQWDGTDQQGNLQSSGVYICKMQVNDFSQSRNLVFLR